MNPQHARHGKAPCTATQTIAAQDGDKRFMPGGREGLLSLDRQTGGSADRLLRLRNRQASTLEATGHAVVAFNAGNLEPVVALRAKYPSLKIFIAADDHLTGNLIRRWQKRRQRRRR
jgi:phage/plasmid primase-like uncharacterized protein